ncbi:MAG: hypothetical protein EBZ48_10715 [Proteobacteria bacterium]|nr:hypothetical protein [Pseudomonadota bacterium]
MPPKPKFSANYDELLSNQGQPLSTATIAIYKAALNKIAATGYRDKDDLLKRQDAVIKVIKDEFPTDAKRRVVLSAIFRVLDGVPLDKKRAYYDLFQASKAPVKSQDE